MLFAIIKMVNDMNYKRNIKKQSYVIAISAILLAIAVAGTSYALFFQVDSNSNNQVVETGSLAVTQVPITKPISETELLARAVTDALSSETLINVAKKYNRTPAQTSLRWVMQHGLLPLPKSLNAGRIEENTKSFDFEISDEDMKIIDEAPYCGGQCAKPDEVDY